MPFTRDIPQPNDLISASQSQILNNFNGSDDSFGRDHYAFSNTSGNTGFHDKVTTPARMAHPDATDNSILYSYQDISAIGPIQYSKGKTRVDQGNQVSTPLTCIQSSTTPISINNLATTNVLDFSGISRAFANLYMGNFSNSTGKILNIANILYTGSGSHWFIINSLTTNTLAAVNSSTTLQIINLTGSIKDSVFWTLQFLRIEI